LVDIVRLKNMFVSVLCVLLISASFAPPIKSAWADIAFGVPTQEVRPSALATTHVIFLEFKNQPMSILLGAGFNSFGNVWNMYMPKEISATKFWNEDFSSGNSFFATSVLEIGLPATLFLFFVSLLVVPLIFVRRFNGSAVSPSARGLSGAIVFGVAWALWYTPASFFFVILAFYGGVLFSVANFDIKRISRTADSRWYTFVLSLVGLALVVTSLSSLLALHAYGKGVIYLKEDPPEYDKAITYFESSLFFMELAETLRSLSFAHIDNEKEVLVGQYSAEKIDIAENGANLAVKFADEARIKDGDNYRTHISFGNALLFSGVIKDDTSILERALESFSNAIVRAPSRVLPLMSKVHVLIRLGRQEEAAVTLKSILELRPDYEPALDLLRDLDLD